MSEHTEGPWDWGQLEDGIFGVYATSPVSTIAIIRTGPNAAGHARLIAAAPELLDALELMLLDFADYPAAERPCHAFNVARAAIAKAKGGNQ